MQATIFVVAIVVSAYAVLVYTGWLGPYSPTSDSQITSIEIFANSTDIMYL